MDAEKSSNSSFEDLSNINEAELKAAVQDFVEEEKKSILGDHIATDESKPKKKQLERKNSRSKSNDDDICDILGNGQLLKKLIRPGKPDSRPTRGDLVTISLTGKLADGTVVEKKTDIQVHVGDFEVVQGLDMALPLMNIGEESKITVDPRFAYGSIGLNNDENPETIIPPESTITYRLHLINSKTETFADLNTFEIRRKYGTSKKERANFWYNRNEYNTAIQLYRRALDFLDDREGNPDAHFDRDDLDFTNSEMQMLLEDRLIVYNNMAMAQIKVSAFDAALKSVENVLRCQPENSKALYRKGRILEARGETKSAIETLQKAATFDPDNRVIQQDLAKLLIKSRREEHNEKEMYQKMLGQAKKLEQKNKPVVKQENTDNSTLKLLGYLMGTILVGVAGVAIYRYKY